MDRLCRILLVEDETIARQALRYIIGQEKESYEIVGEASNGKEALCLIDQLRPDVIISDIVMPVMNGIDLIKAINLRYPDIIVLVLSGHDDFELVKSAFRFGVDDYILKPSLEPGELLDKLHNASARLGLTLGKPSLLTPTSGSQILSRLLRGEPVQKSASFEFFSPGCFYLMACDVKGLSVHARQGYAVEVIRSVVSPMLTGFAFSDTLCQYQSVCGFLVGAKVQEKAEVRRILESAAEHVAKEIPAVFFALSEPYEQLGDTSARFATVLEHLELKFFCYGRNLVFCANSAISDVPVVFNRKAFSGAIQENSLERAEQELLDYLHKCCQAKNMSEGELKKTVEYAIYTAVNLLEDTGHQVELLKKDRLPMFAQIDACRYAEELIACVKEIFAKIRQNALPRQASDDILFRKIQEYIGENYSGQITLHSVAKRFHVSYSYLSSYFNVYFKRGFNEYLNGIRVEKAKEMLTESHRSLSEISEALGYSEQSYFGKVFKKFTGYSPSTYRKRNLR